MRQFALILLAFAGMSATSMGAAELKGVNLGTYVSGPKLKPADLEGKVVVFEYWGVNCPPCRASIPHINELAAVGGPDVLAVIANHCQGPGRTQAVWRECGGNDKPTVIEAGDLPKSNVSGIPRIFVFDHNGKQVFDGSPSAVTVAMLRKLVDAAPGPLVGAGPYSICTREAASLRNSGQSIVPTLKSLRAKMVVPEKPSTYQEKGKTEATAILADVTTYLDRQFKQIEADRTADPYAAQMLLDRMLILVKGDELGKPFVDLAAQVKDDKAFQNEVAAGAMLTRIKDDIVRNAKRQGAAAQRETKQNAIQSIAALEKKYPGTKALAEAQKIAETLK